jgi:acyl-CoA thioester hydrolase
VARAVFRVRYYECDMQRVVHNAVYLAWCDDLGDQLFRAAGLGADEAWDVMVKTATVTWTSSSRLGEEICVDAAVTRWGNTSFDVTYTGTRADDPVFEATITYVAVDMTSEVPVPVPEDFRTALAG